MNKMKMLVLIAMISCGLKKNSETNIIVKDSGVHVRIYRDSVLVDSLLTLNPLTESNPQRFISLNHNDTIENLLQRKIFEIGKVATLTSRHESIIKFWFTRVISKTDSTQDIGLFLVLNNDKAIERCGFRVTSNGEFIGLNDDPLLNEKFESTDVWNAKTILLDE